MTLSITIAQYDITLSLLDESSFSTIAKTIDNNLSPTDHHHNFKIFCEMEDNGFVSIKRKLSEDEKNTILDKQIAGEFTLADELEKQNEDAWIINFLQYTKQ